MSELAADGIPVAVSLRVLKLSRQPYYRWRKQQVTEAELVEAYRANALLDAHRDDPEFGYRVLAGDQANDVEGVNDRDRAGQSFAGGGPVSGELVHRHHLDAVLPCLGVGLQPGLERRFGAARDHVQQSRRAGPVPGWGEVDDHGDVLVAAPSMAPDMLVNTDHADGIETGRIIDQQPLALGEDGVVGGVPGNP